MSASRFANGFRRGAASAFRSSGRTGFSKTASFGTAAGASSSLALGRAVAVGLAAGGAAFLASSSPKQAFAAGSTPIQGVPGSNQERTFIAIKPDGVQRHLVGEIIARFEKRGYKLVGLKLMQPTLRQAQDHYSDLSRKPFYGGLCKYFSSGPIVAMVFEGKDAVKTGRRILGETNPLDSPPGSIRGDYCLDLGRNIIHGSDSTDAAESEIKFWFSPAEVADYSMADAAWLYEKP